MLELKQKLSGRVHSEFMLFLSLVKVNDSHFDKVFIKIIDFTVCVETMYYILIYLYPNFTQLLRIDTMQRLVLIYLFLLRQLITKIVLELFGQSLICIYKLSKNCVFNSSKQLLKLSISCEIVQAIRSQSVQNLLEIQDIFKRLLSLS